MGLEREKKKELKNVKKEIKNLERERINEIKTIINGEWHSIVKDFSYNLKAGAVRINNKIYFFDEINEAELVQYDSFRTTSVTNAKTKGTSKKHTSLVGAVAGGAIAGPIGAVVGGSSLGRTTNGGKTKSVTHSNNIAQCYHLGVNVNLGGFTTEIVILSRAVDQSSFRYRKAFAQAQSIVDALRTLSQKVVPKTYSYPEENKNVLDYNTKIENAKMRLQELENTFAQSDSKNQF